MKLNLVFRFLCQICSIAILTIICNANIIMWIALKNRMQSCFRWWLLLYIRDIFCSSFYYSIQNLDFQMSPLQKKKQFFFLFLCSSSMMSDANLAASKFGLYTRSRATLTISISLIFEDLKITAFHMNSVSYL